MNNAPLAFFYDIRVRYADTDQMQVVYNGKYFEYFEVGRTELLRKLGLPYSEFERSGTRLPVIEANCKFYLPAKYDDVITIETQMNKPVSVRLKLNYRVFRKDTSELLAEGYTIHAFQDIATSKPIRPPKTFLDAVSQSLD